MLGGQLPADSKGGTKRATPEPEGSGGRNECTAYKDWIPASAEKHPSPWTKGLGGMTEAKLITS